jgi:hypothetical protein
LANCSASAAIFRNRNPCGGEARNRAREATLRERAVKMRDDALDLARDHPLLVVAGGLAIGFAVSLLVQRSPTRKAGKKVAKKTSGLAVLAVELALPLIRDALIGARDAGREGLGRLEGIGATAGERARDFGYRAAGRATGAGKRIARVVRARAH